jgi:hypothetical protein
MKIEIVVDPSRPQAAPLAQRVAPAAAAAAVAVNSTKSPRLVSCVLFTFVDHWTLCSSWPPVLEGLAVDREDVDEVEKLVGLRGQS